MKMINLSKMTSLVSLGKGFVLAYRPELLLGTSITATLGGVVLAAKGGWDARGLVENHKIENPEADLKAKDLALMTWKCYVPAGVTTLGAVGATTGLHWVHVKEKKAMLATSLAAIEEFKESAERFTNAALESAANEDGVVTVEDSDGVVEELYLVRDAKTGRDIWSNEARIDEAVNQVNSLINSNGDCDLNEFYTFAGYSGIEEGLNIGWSGEFVAIKWTNGVRDDGRPIRIFTFQQAPKTGFDR